MTKVRQLGLTCKNGEAMEAFAERVGKFNEEKGLEAVSLEGREQPDGHWDLVMEFKSRAYANAFWTHPEYQVNVLT
jgi:uncharacterized protein (DUF1330 family)